MVTNNCQMLKLATFPVKISILLNKFRFFYLMNLWFINVISLTVTQTWRVIRLIIVNLLGNTILILWRWFVIWFNLFNYNLCNTLDISFNVLYFTYKCLISNIIIIMIKNKGIECIIIALFSNNLIVLT